MEKVLNPEIEIDELIRPITYEVFRDPVIVKDSHVYEEKQSLDGYYRMVRALLLENHCKLKNYNLMII
jgi:hypothetical protein